MSDEESRHESHGMICLSRFTVSGDGANFFGSPTKQRGGIGIRISEGESEFDRISGRRYYGRRVICDVHLTAVQFAELITTPNTGEGVPCTLKHVRDGKLLNVEAPPTVTESEALKVREAFLKEVEEKRGAIKSVGRRIDALLEKGSKMTNADRKRVRAEISTFLRFMEDSLPFAAKCFEESAHEAVAAAKVEIEAFAEMVAIRTGVKELTEGDAPNPIEIPSAAVAQEPTDREVRGEMGAESEKDWGGISEP